MSIKQLLLLGGGHTHLEVVRRFAAAPPDDTRVVLVSPERYTPYSGMLPGLVAGHYGFHDCHIDLERLCACARVHFIRSSVIAFDARRRRVGFADGTDADFDVVSFDIGSTPNVKTTPGAIEHAAPVKPVSAFLANWERFLATGPADFRAPVLAVVGAGAGGVELALAMEYRFRATGPGAAHVHLFTDTAHMLPAHQFGVRWRVERILQERKVHVHVLSRIVRVERGVLHRETGTAFASDFIVWATGASAPEWVGRSALMTDEHGFITVESSLRSVSHPCVFAAGDVASMIDHPRPKAGVYAVRQGPILAENLRRALANRPLAVYKPQKAALALISAGDRYAVASWNRIALEGAWVWRWKDRIDRRFTARYHAS